MSVNEQIARNEAAITEIIADICKKHFKENTYSIDKFKEGAFCLEKFNGTYNVYKAQNGKKETLVFHKSIFKAATDLFVRLSPIDKIKEIQGEFAASLIQLSRIYD